MTVTSPPDDVEPFEQPKQYPVFGFSPPTPPLVLAPSKSLLPEMRDESLVHHPMILFACMRRLVIFVRTPVLTFAPIIPTRAHVIIRIAHLRHGRELDTPPRPHPRLLRARIREARFHLLDRYRARDALAILASVTGIIMLLLVDLGRVGSVGLDRGVARAHVTLPPRGLAHEMRSPAAWRIRVAH